MAENKEGATAIYLAYDLVHKLQGLEKEFAPSKNQPHSQELETIRIYCSIRNALTSINNAIDDLKNYTDTFNHLENMWYENLLSYQREITEKVGKKIDV